MRRAAYGLIGNGWETAQHRYRALRAVWTRCSRYYSLLAFGVVLSLALTACGGGGGGGGGNRQILNGSNGIRNLSKQNPRVGSLVNNVGQAKNLLHDFTARPINPGSHRKITPQEALLNASNALADDEVINLIKQNYPNWSSFLTQSGDTTTIDFDQVPDGLGEWLGGMVDRGEHGVISRQQLPKLFKGKMTVRSTTSGNTKEVQVTCPEEKPLQVNPESSDPQTPKLKLVGNLKVKLPTRVQPGGQAQGQIDYNALKITDMKTARGNRPGDTVILGNEQRDEWNAVRLKLDQEDDDVPSFDIEGMDWEGTQLAWLDDDLLQYFDESITDAYLTWTLQSEGWFYIYDEVDSLDCAGYYGAGWSFQPLPRSRRQAELLLPFTFDWDDSFDGCGAVDDYQLIFTYNETTYIVQSLEDSEYIDWCEETDSELDAYLAALLNLPPGADLADTVLTAEAWATGLPEFMYYLYQLHNRLASPTQNVSIEGSYPDSYAATFTNFEYADSQLNGKISFEFSSTQDGVQLTAVFERGFTWSGVALEGTLKMSLDESTGQMTIEIGNFSWNIPDESQGSVPSGTLSSVITLENNNLTLVRTSALDMRLNVRNLLITPPQTYNVTLGVSQPLEWPVNSCDYSTSGVLTIRGQVAGQPVEMRVDFGADGECKKAVISSGGGSAIYNLDAGLFESLTRLRGQTRAAPQPRSLRFWHKPTPRS